MVAVTAARQATGHSRRTTSGVICRKDSTVIVAG